MPHLSADFSLKFTKSMRFRITLGIILILSVILLVLGNITISEQRERMMSQMDAYGSETAEFIAEISIIPIRKFSIYQLENYVAQLEKGEHISYCEIYDVQGNALAHSTKNTRPNGVNAEQDHDTRVYTAEIQDDRKKLGTVELGLNSKPVLSKIDQTSRYIILAFWLELILIACAVSYFIHKSLVSPILRISETTRKIASGSFITSAEARRSDELGLLAKTINTVSVNLAEAQKNLELKVAQRTQALTQAKNASDDMAKEFKIVSNEHQALLDNSPVAILFVTTDRVIQRVNKEFTNIFGYTPEEVIGRTTEVLYQNEQDYLHAAEEIYNDIRQKGYCQAKLNLQQKDGTPIICLLRGRLTMHDEDVQGVTWSIENITTRLKMEEELLKIEKLESIGVLAGGIAHDFNNILVAIIGNISLAERLISDNPKVARLLQNSRNASLRAKDLTIKLLTFAKGGGPVRTIASLPEILEESATFVLSGSNVKCSYKIEDNLWAVHMDKGQINQVVQNLVLNADQAMPDGGTIQISCRNVVLDAEEEAEVKSGKYIKMEVVDTGSGIEERHIGNIFDPYFSTKTKSTDKGSGLGLSIVHSIVNKHGGSIRVRSTLGKGTSFTLYLPAVEMVFNPEKEVKPDLQEGKGVVLLMDDETTIHEVGGEMLEYLGYETLHAYDGEEALALYQEHLSQGKKIDLVIMDLTIPGGMGGAVAVHKLLEIDEDAKVLVSSGYSDDPIVQNYRQQGFANIISKPYQLFDLSNIIAETLKA